jgi:hypothetical protein
MKFLLYETFLAILTRQSPMYSVTFGFGLFSSFAREQLSLYAKHAL